MIRSVATTRPCAMASDGQHRALAGATEVEPLAVGAHGLHRPEHPKPQGGLLLADRLVPLRAPVATTPTLGNGSRWGGRLPRRTVWRMVTTPSVLLFLTASIPLILFPGPSVAFILATTLRGGRRTGLAATAGVESGYLVHVVGAVVGISAVIAASAELFTVVKVVGAAWLLWMAWRTFRARSEGTLADLHPAGPTAVRPARSLHGRRIAAGCWWAPSTRRPPCSTWPSCRSS